MEKRAITAALFLLLALILSQAALASWSLDSDYVDVELSISSGLDIIRTPGSKLEYVTANVSFIPQTISSQTVLSLKATPEPKLEGNEYIFRWDSPIPQNPVYNITAKVRTKGAFSEVRAMPFPYSGFSEEVRAFTLPGKIIDSNNSNIIEKASELASGESDYYAVVYRMADWTKENVKYDLSTLNTKASNKASWVLAKKDGVCDEITNLFIALLRAVGIPARFISGIAYTDSPKFPRNWGAHGWAEVYFPGTGWVPFDVTYGEFGYVDPTHIILKESFDSGESDTRYEWLGKDVDIAANPIVVSASLIKHSGSMPERISLSVDVVQDTVGVGSYNIIEATVTNLRNSYVSDFLFLANINEMELDGNKYRSIMLKPLETRKFYWLVKVMENMDSHYTYTFPITVANLRNTSADSQFYVIPGATVFSKQEMESVIDAAKEEESKVYSKQIGINCSQEKSSYYAYDDPEVSCVVKNTGNFPFRDLRFCFKDECRTADLAISQEKSFDYTLHAPKAGINKIEFSVDGKDVSKSFFYDLSVLDPPEISIDDVEYPAEIEFKQPYTVSFTLKKKSSSAPGEVKVKFDAAGAEKEIEQEKLSADRKFLFNLNSEDLSVKPNRFTVAVIYSDLNNRTYTENETFGVKLKNVTFGQRVVIFMYDFDRWLRNLFK